MESIALESAGLAHILNAEGEKIQFAIKNTHCLHDLLEINASVGSTIEDIMWLEFISYHKLKAIVCGDWANTPPSKECNNKNNIVDTFQKSNVKKTDCTRQKENVVCNKNIISVCGRVFYQNGEPCRKGVVTARGDKVCSTCICYDGKYSIFCNNSSNKIVINAISQGGKTDSFLLKQPFKDSYQVDMFLNG